MLHAAVLLLGLAFGIDAGAPATIIEKSGFAYDRDSGELLYTEHHQQLLRHGRTVGQVIHYRDPQGKVIASKQLDYRTDPLLPDFLLTDHRTGYVEGFLREAGRGWAFCRQGSGGRLEREPVAATTHGVADAGFDRLIETHWEELLSGAIIEQPFLVPSRMEFVPFTIQKTGTLERDGLELVAFKLHTRNRVLRLFVSPLRVLYDAEQRMLVEYSGISNLRDESLHNYDVRIEFPVEGRTWRSDVSIGQQPVSLPGGLVAALDTPPTRSAR